MQNRATFAILSSLFMSAAPHAALAQSPAAVAAPDLSPGVMVYDPAGGEVGKIESRSGDTIVIGLDGGPIALPASSFGLVDKRVAIGVTRADLVAARDKAAAARSEKLEAALVQGAEVRGANGQVALAKVKTIAADGVVISTASGDIKIARSAFFLAPGGLAMNYSPEQFAALLAKIDKTSADREAALAAALQPGAEVHSLKGLAILGTVVSVGSEAVVVKASSGEVSVPRSAFTITPAGLSAAYTAEQFAAAVGSAS